MASREAPGPLRERRHRRDGSRGDPTHLSAGRPPWECGLPPGDDGEAPRLRVLHGTILFAQDREGVLGGRAVPGPVRKSAARSRQHRGLPQAALEGSLGVIWPGTESLPASRLGEAGSRRRGRQQDEGERFQTQVDVLRSSGEVRGRDQEAGRGSTERSGTSRYRGGCSLRQGQSG